MGRGSGALEFAGQASQVWGIDFHDVNQADCLRALCSAGGINPPPRPSLKPLSAVLLEASDNLEDSVDLAYADNP